MHELIHVSSFEIIPIVADRIPVTNLPKTFLLSLSLLDANLNKQMENDLQQFLSKRISKGSLFIGQGNVSAVVLGWVVSLSEPLGFHFSII